MKWRKRQFLVIITARAFNSYHCHFSVTKSHLLFICIQFRASISISLGETNYRERIEENRFIQTDKIKTQESEKSISQEQNLREGRGNLNIYSKNQILELVIDDDNSTECHVN